MLFHDSKTSQVDYIQPGGMLEYFHSINIMAADDLSPGARESADMVLNYLARNILLPHWKVLNNIPTAIPLHWCLRNTTMNWWPAY